MSDTVLNTILNLDTDNKQSWKTVTALSSHKLAQKDGVSFTKKTDILK